MTGGLYLYSTNLRDISIRDNIFSDNRGFQIGYSELYLNDYSSWTAAARAKNIQIKGNLINGGNTVGAPIESGGDRQDQVKIYAVNGDGAILSAPKFEDPTNQDFTLRPGSPASVDHSAVGAYPSDSSAALWWKRDFPPKLFSAPL
jgi:hypothetical protein